MYNLREPQQIVFDKIRQNLAKDKYYFVYLQ